MHNMTKQKSNLPWILLGFRVLSEQKGKFRYEIGKAKTATRTEIRGFSQCILMIPKTLMCVRTHMYMYVCTCVSGTQTLLYWLMKSLSLFFFEFSGLL